MTKVKKRTSLKRKGFTLIELVCVIAILGILAGIAIPRILNSNASAAGAKLLGDLRTIDSASTIYRTKNSTVPTLEELVAANLLADVPIPPRQTMLIMDNHGVNTEYEPEAKAYNLNADGRATYTSSKLSNATVEDYLAGYIGPASYADMLDAARAAMTAGAKGGSAICEALKKALDGQFPQVEASLLQTLYGDDYTTKLSWRINANYNNSALVYFATSGTNTNGSWNATLVVVDGVLYKTTSGKSVGIANIFSTDKGGGSTTAQITSFLTNNGFEQAGLISKF